MQTYKTNNIVFKHLIYSIGYVLLIEAKNRYEEDSED